MNISFKSRMSAFKNIKCKKKLENMTSNNSSKNSKKNSLLCYMISTINLNQHRNYVSKKMLLRTNERDLFSEYSRVQLNVFKITSKMSLLLYFRTPERFFNMLVLFLLLLY